MAAQDDRNIYDFEEQQMFDQGKRADSKFINPFDRNIRQMINARGLFTDFSKDTSDIN